MIGGLLALLIPVANGLTTGDWPWVAWTAGHGAVVGVDVGALLFGLALLGLAACLEVEATPPSADSRPSQSSRPAGEARSPEEARLKTA